jgi:predicted RNase H-like HicB family nuclease
MQYVIIVEEEKTGFGAYAPDLPGCVAVAETREEVLQLMQEAIEFHLEGLKEKGLPIRAPLEFSNYPVRLLSEDFTARRENLYDDEL